VVIGTKETFCRVCGFDDHLDERYLVGEPQYIFCDCCGSESGPDDLYPDLVRRSRMRWIDAGRMWPDLANRPADWDPDAALASLPAKCRDL
jgi:hypothetical protein